MFLPIQSQLRSDSIIRPDTCNNNHVLLALYQTEAISKKGIYEMSIRDKEFHGGKLHSLIGRYHEY